MSVYHTLCFLSAAAMVIAFVNSKIGKMQTTIAITAGSMILSLLILIAGQNDWFHLTEIATETVTSINFEDFLLKGILGFLLFAGGLGIKLPNLKDQKWEITVLALGATLFSTFFIGFVLTASAKLSVFNSILFTAYSSVRLSLLPTDCSSRHCQKA